MLWLLIQHKIAKWLVKEKFGCQTRWQDEDKYSAIMRVGTLVHYGD